MISLIAAVDENLLIGNSQGMPWHIREDLAYFKQVTKGKTIVMGRKTFDTIGRPLPHRNNVVLTTKNIEIAGVNIIHDLKHYLSNVAKDEEVIVIGGAQIYALAYPFVDRLYITHIHHAYEGDVYFPRCYFTGEFIQTEARDLLTSEGLKLTFATYQRQQ